jgi:integrase
MNRGHIRKRGKGSWELKFDAGRDPATGKRQTRYHSFRGTKRGAQAKLIELLAAVGAGAYVDPSKITVAEYLRARVDQWEAAGDISARTAQRYRQLVENQIVPHIGGHLLQKLRHPDIERWQGTLRTGGRRRGQGGLAARTIGHAHRVLSKALNDAVKSRIVTCNEAQLQGAPKVEEEEMFILKGEEVSTLLGKLEGHVTYAPMVLALFTGMRLGEVLALRWGNCDIDDTQMIRVREALEETKANGIIFKAPKTKAGRRDITLPNIVVNTLREHRRQQRELSLQLGLGKLADDALVFPTIEGGPRSPAATSREWGLVAQSIGLSELTFHALRHTHASQLIDAGVDVVTISQRLGHANPKVTLQVYAHLFRKDDSKAAMAINAALAGHALG